MASGISSWSLLSPKEAALGESQYDPLYRLTNQNISSVGVVGYGYDANGNVTGIASSTSGGTLLTYQYDSLNRLTNVIDGRLSGTQNISYRFDGVGNLQSYTYPSGVTNLYQYDALNRLTRNGS